MQPRKLLIVDDSKLMHKMYEVMLRQYALVFALDGRAALDKLRDHDDVDLVILDTNMPNMNAEEFIGELRGSGNAAPVLVVTSNDWPQAIAGANATIEKPFNSDQLLDKIAQLPAVKAGR